MVATISNVLATIFFALAFLWFVIAVSYAASVVLFLKMRREGRFHNMQFNDPAFGRYYFCGERLYLPMGWIFRRFILQYQNEQERRSNKGRVMNKAERREAMQSLLHIAKPSKSVDTSADTSNGSETDTDGEAGDIEASCEVSSTGSDSGDLENVCAICLGHYANEGSAWSSTVCKHKFHRECLLAWLEQPGKIECPCCREPFVEEDAVWKAVKQLRKKHKRRSDPERQTNKRETGSTNDTDDDIETPSESADADC